MLPHREVLAPGMLLAPRGAHGQSYRFRAADFAAELRLAPAAVCIASDEHVVDDPVEVVRVVVVEFCPFEKETPKKKASLTLQRQRKSNG